MGKPKTEYNKRYHTGAMRVAAGLTPGERYFDIDKALRVAPPADVQRNPNPDWPGGKDDGVTRVKVLPKRTAFKPMTGW